MLYTSLATLPVTYNSQCTTISYKIIIFTILIPQVHVISFWPNHFFTRGQYLPGMLWQSRLSSLILHGWLTFSPISLQFTTCTDINGPIKLTVISRGVYWLQLHTGPMLLDCNDTMEEACIIIIIPKFGILLFSKMQRSKMGRETICQKMKPIL